MTKEELEKESEEFLQKKWGTSKMLILGGDAREVLADFAESREKQIQIDAEQIRNLQKQNGELTDRVRELEQQIEKMKNWCNCKNYQQCLIELAEQGKGMNPSECCVNCKKWEIKENDKRRTETGSRRKF